MAAEKQLSQTEMILKARKAWYSAKLNTTLAYEDVKSHELAYIGAKHAEEKALDFYLSQLETLASEVK